MGWIEAILIIAGLTLDIFAAMMCQGSLVRAINKKLITAVCFITGFEQLLTLFLGCFLGRMASVHYLDDQGETLSEIIAIIILFGLAVKLLINAVVDDNFQEKLELRQKLSIYLKRTAITGLYTFLAGIAFGLIGNTNTFMILIMVFVCTVVFVVSGMVVGYRFGFERKKQVFIIGALLLAIAGVDLIVRLALHIL